MTARTARLCALITAGMIWLTFASAAQAWYVDISITGAGRVYETTDADELDEHCPDAIEGFASPGTTPTGSLGASCRAGDAAGDYGHGWTVRYVAEPAAGYTFKHWTTDGRTSPGPVICDSAPGGSSTYTGTACQFTTFANLQTRAVFDDESNPAMSSLTGPNQVVNGPATFNFSAVADPTLSGFECRVAGVHDWLSCSSGRQENPGTGSYTFEVRAVDWSGNRSAIDEWDWTVDKVAPETSLSGGPSGTTGSTSASFEFSSNESGTFVCTLDGSAVSCGSPKNYSGLGHGEHTFTVAAVDVAGNTDPSPATRTWTVDNVAPETTIDGGPSGSTADTSAQFTFSSNDPGATFMCQLDGGTAAACTSPRSFTGLGVGDHTFTVWAVDAVGNADATKATRTWTVVAPAVEPIDPGTGGDGGGTTPPPTTPTPPPGTGTSGFTPVAQAASITGSSRATRTASRKGVFTLLNRVVCPAACKVAVLAKLRRSTYAKSSFTLLNGGERGIRLKLTKKALRALKRSKRAKLVVTIRLTPAGTTKAIVKTVRLTLSVRR